MTDTGSGAWRSARPGGEDGQTLVLVAFMMPALVLMLGLVLTVANVYLRDGQLQAAADASALAAAATRDCSQATRIGGLNDPAATITCALDSTGNATVTASGTAAVYVVPGGPVAVTRAATAAPVGGTPGGPAFTWTLPHNTILYPGYGDLACGSRADTYGLGPWPVQRSFGGTTYTFTPPGNAAVGCMATPTEDAGGTLTPDVITGTVGSTLAYSAAFKCAAGTDAGGTPLCHLVAIQVGCGTWPGPAAEGGWCFKVTGTGAITVYGLSWVWRIGGNPAVGPSYDGFTWYAWGSSTGGTATLPDASVLTG